MFAGYRAGLAEVGGPCLLGRSVLGLDGFSYSSLERRWTVGCELEVPAVWFSAIFWAIRTGVGMHPGGWYAKPWLSVDPKVPPGTGLSFFRAKLSNGSCLGLISKWLPGVGTIF